MGGDAVSRNLVMRLVYLYLGLAWFAIGCIQWATGHVLSASFPGLAAIYCAVHFQTCSLEEDDE